MVSFHSGSLNGAGSLITIHLTIIEDHRSAVVLSLTALKQDCLRCYYQIYAVIMYTISSKTEESPEALRSRVFLVGNLSVRKKKSTFHFNSS